MSQLSRIRPRSASKHADALAELIAALTLRRCRAAVRRRRLAVGADRRRPGRPRQGQTGCDHAAGEGHPGGAEALRASELRTRDQRMIREHQEAAVQAVRSLVDALELDGLPPLIALEGEMVTGTPRGVHVEIGGCNARVVQAIADCLKDHACCSGRVVPGAGHAHSTGRTAHCAKELEHMTTPATTTAPPTTSPRPAPTSSTASRCASWSSWTTDTASSTSVHPAAVSRSPAHPNRSAPPTAAKPCAAASPRPTSTPNTAAPADRPQALALALALPILVWALARADRARIHASLTEQSRRLHVLRPTSAGPRTGLHPPCLMLPTCP